MDVATREEMCWSENGGEMAKRAEESRVKRGW